MGYFNPVCGVDTDGSVVAMVDGTVTNVAPSRSVKAVSESNSIAGISWGEVSALATVPNLDRVQFEVSSECEP